MVKIFKYSFFDFVRSRWMVLYLLFFLVVTWGMLYLGNDLTKAIAGLLNLTLIIVPLIATLFGVIHFYNSREFIEMLLAQPVKRRDIFSGMFMGMSFSLTVSYILGTGIPLLAYGLGRSGEIFRFLHLAFSGIFLTLIFSAFASFFALVFENRLKGFGMAILFWLFLVFIYDGLFLITLLVFGEYPVEKLALFLTLLNPVDLSRILVMLQLDMSAMLGYTGAVFRKFFGTATGMLVSYAVLSLWAVVPFMLLLLKARKKDF